jgi:hypothetical protein
MGTRPSNAITKDEVYFIVVHDGCGASGRRNLGKADLPLLAYPRLPDKRTVFWQAWYGYSSNIKGGLMHNLILWQR